MLDVPVFDFEKSQVLIERLLEAIKEHDAEMAELITTRYAEAVQKTVTSNMPDA